MKRIIQLTLTITLFSIFITSSSFAQPNLGNRTACRVEVTVVYGSAACGVNGAVTSIIPPFTVIPSGVPVGDVIIAARGRYVGTSGCEFVVGIPCSGFPFNVSVPCTLACLDYRANLSNWGVVVFH